MLISTFSSTTQSTWVMFHLHGKKRPLFQFIKEEMRDRALAKNYRPISLTSTIMKVLERIIRKQVIDFLSDHNYFNPNQHGFRHGRSCLSVLLDVYDNMMTSLSNNPKSSVDMIYLDYAKAFDKVDHGVLLNKPKNFGICGKLGEWMHSFLRILSTPADEILIKICCFFFIDYICVKNSFLSHDLYQKV